MNHPAKQPNYPPYPGYQPYPRVVDNADGQPVTVRDHLHETQITGCDMNPDGSFVEPDSPRILPPTLQRVLDAGYSQQAAEQIVEEEQVKFENGYPPYGNIIPPVQPVQTENKQVAPGPEGVSDAAKQADVHEDPLG